MKYILRKIFPLLRASYHACMILLSFFPKIGRSFSLAYQYFKFWLFS